MSASKVPAKQSTPSDRAPPSTFVRRRNLLLLLGAELVVSNIPRWFSQASRSSISDAASSQAAHPIPAQQQHDFLTLSRLLTADQQLDPDTSADICDALCAQSERLLQQVVTLSQLAQTQQVKTVEELLEALATVEDKVELTSVLHQIIDAWYLGEVGNGLQRQVITFESALMFDQVQDILMIPSYCAASVAHWAKQP